MSTTLKKVKKTKDKKFKNTKSTTISATIEKKEVIKKCQSITFKVCDTKKQVVRSEPLDLLKVINSNIDKKDSGSNSLFTISEKNKISKINKEIIEKLGLKSNILSSSFNRNGGISESRIIGSNSFIHSAILAFSQHHHFSIRPDDMWMAILNQLSIHINVNSEKLRDKVVDFQGKKMLEVKTDFSILNAPHDKMTLEMVEQIEKNLKDPSIREWLIPEFTTTTNSDRIVYSAALMSTMKGFFDYRFGTRCGIPEITLNGTIDDWISIKNRLNKLLEFEIKSTTTTTTTTTSFNVMEEWVKLLFPIIDNFISTASGKPDIEFWSKIVDKSNKSGGPFITGWVTAFAIYDKLNNLVLDKPIENSNEWLTITYGKIANGFVSVPITLKDYDNTIYQSNLYAGHIAVLVDNKNYKLTPSLDWALVLNS